MGNTHTLPNPYPYYEVIVNNSSAYLIVHSKTPTNDTKRITYRIDEKGFEITNKNPIGRPEHNWQDYLPLRIIQYIYFDILDSYRENAEVISIAHLRRIKSGEIPF